jgi:hypothetical protein
MENLLKQIEKTKFKNLNLENLITIIRTIEEIGLSKRFQSKIVINLSPTLLELFDHIHTSINKVKENSYTTISSEDLNLLLDYYPDERFTGNVDKYGSYYRFSLLEKGIQAYFLGLPIERIDIENIDKNNITKELVDKRNDIKNEIKKWHKAEIDQYLKFPFISNISTHDIDSIHHSPIESFLPFDVIRYVQNNKLLTIVRSEFEYVKGHGHHPWNFTELPKNILEEIERKIVLSKKMKLPPCQPWSCVYDFCMCGYDKIDMTNVSTSSVIFSGDDIVKEYMPTNKKMHQSDNFLGKK